MLSRDFYVEKTPIEDHHALSWPCQAMFTNTQSLSSFASISLSSSTVICIHGNNNTCAPTCLLLLEVFYIKYIRYLVMEPSSAYAWQALHHSTMVLVLYKPFLGSLKKSSYTASIPCPSSQHPPILPCLHNSGYRR